MSESSETGQDVVMHNNVLRIVDGLHAGASRLLADEEMILVGSGDDCDIVLADNGVAGHHALVSIVGGRFQVRALDAPLRIGSQEVHPGDPVELSAVQQVRIGEAVIAFGREDDPAWDSFVTVFASHEEKAKPGSALVRRLPMIAGVAAISLVSLAIFAAVIPSSDKGPDVRERLQTLLDEHHVSDHQVIDGLDGRPTVTGAIDDTAALEHLRSQLRNEGIDATLQIRTGEHIANDVAEMFRAQSIPVEARYIGNGDVEVVGNFKDSAQIAHLAGSRAISDIPGVQRILPRTPTGDVPEGEVEQAQAEEQVYIVAVVRGEDPYVEASDGRRFEPGDNIPGKGTLISIGEFAHVLGSNGELTKIIPGPPPEKGAKPGDDAASDDATSRADDAERVDDAFASVEGGAHAG